MDTRDLRGGGAQGWKKWGDIGQRVQIFIYKMNRFRGSTVEHGDYS